MTEMGSRRGARTYKKVRRRRWRREGERKDTVSTRSDHKDIFVAKGEQHLFEHKFAGNLQPQCPQCNDLSN